MLSLKIIFACFCQNANDDKEASEFLDDDPMDLDHDEEHLHFMEGNAVFTSRSSANTNRLNEGEVTYARNQRLQEIYMWSIIREMAIYFCFLALLYIVVYGNSQAHSQLQVQHLRRYFLSPGQEELDYTKISTINQYWDWLETQFAENIRAQPWYNGRSPRNLSGFINDKSNRLIGWATMRQVRVKSMPCHSPNLAMTTCHYDYSAFDEDKHSYEPGWVNATLTTFSPTIRQSFVYQSSDHLGTQIIIGDHGSYVGGGYVYEFRGRMTDLRGNLSELHQLGWIDSQTRAVIIQMTLYDPHAELFTWATFLLEILSTVGLQPSARFEPLNFYAFSSVLQLVGTILYMLMIVYFMIVEIRTFIELKRQYLFRFWSYIDVGIIICSWTSVGIYIWRYHQYQKIGQLFRETNGYVCVNLQLACYINDLLIYLFGFCCFFGTIRGVLLCRFKQRLCLFIQTLRYAARELISFALMFSVLFISFVLLFYLPFTSKLKSCSSLLATTRMLFETTLMKFDAQQMIGAAAFLGPFAFSLFIFLVVFVCMSMFLTIINGSFRRARDNLKNNNQTIVAYMIKRFQRWTGLMRGNEEAVHAERDARMRLKYHDPIERFPEKMDQLLTVLNRVYMAQKDKKRRT